jgi:hypothetical protein
MLLVGPAWAIPEITHFQQRVVQRLWVIFPRAARLCRQGPIWVIFRMERGVPPARIGLRQSDGDEHKEETSWIAHSSTQ